MGWRFRKYIQIARGIRLNISKKGISFTVGTKGASVNIGKDGAYLNTGIPGTGLYNRQKIYSAKNKKRGNPKTPFTFDKEEMHSNRQDFSKTFEQTSTNKDNSSMPDVVESMDKREKSFDKIYVPKIGYLDPELYDMAFFIVSNQNCNKSLIQNKFSVGEYRISQIVDQLELIGVVKRVSSFRIDVLVKDLNSLELLFERLQTDSVLSPLSNNVEEEQKTEDMQANKDQQCINSNSIQNMGYLDPLLYDVADYLVRKQRGSISQIQRLLASGFRRASHIVNQLEQIGVVKRLPNSELEVLVKDSTSLNSLFDNLKFDGFSENIFGVTKDYCDDVIVIVNSLVKLYQDIKNDESIMYAISDCLPQNYGTKEQKLAILFHADIMKVHQHFGHSLTNLKNREGFAIVLLSSLILGDGYPIDISYGNINKMEDLSKRVSSFFSSISHIFDQYPDENFFFIGQILKRCRRRSFYTRYFTLLYRLFSFIAKVDGSLTNDESLWLNKLLELNPQKENVNIVFNVGGALSDKPGAPKVDSKMEETCKQDSSKEPSKQETCKKESNPTKELNKLIGLSDVKNEINSLSNLVRVQQARKKRGMSVSNISYHCVFTGNPGTGKTTVARIVAEIYKELGVLKKGNLIETDRSGLVGEYVGQTAPKTNAIIDSALDGVLFIDEAYSLVQGGQHDYGMEAISTLLKRMEDDRDRLIVILAGYSKEMEDFINANSGLQSRFNRYIEFPDYTSDELMQIFNYMAKKGDYKLTREASNQVALVIEDAVIHKNSNFGNARFVRNLFEKIIIQQANRIATESEITNEMLVNIEKIDIVNAVK